MPLCFACDGVVLADVRGGIPDGVGQLQPLEYLRFCGKDVTSIPTFNCPSLKKLAMDDFAFEVFPDVQGCTALEEVLVRGSALLQEVPSYVSKMSSIHTFTMDMCKQLARVPDWSARIAAKDIALKFYNVKLPYNFTKSARDNMSSNPLKLLMAWRDSGWKETSIQITPLTEKDKKLLKYEALKIKASQGLEVILD